VGAAAAVHWPILGACLDSQFKLVWPMRLQWNS